MAEAAPTPGTIYRPPAYALLEQDLADIATLADAGIPRNQATILIALHRYSKDIRVTSRWLERVTDLRQPEVSIAMGSLIAAGLITTSENKGLSKGRPVKVYHVEGDVSHYIKNKIAERLTKLNRDIVVVNKIFAGRAQA